MIAKNIKATGLLAGPRFLISLDKDMAVYHIGKITGMLYRLPSNGTRKKAEQLLWIYHTLREFGNFPARQFKLIQGDASGQSD